MSPQLARDIYYEYLGRAFCRQQLDWTKPVIQHECEMEAWAAVVDHVENDELMEVPEVKAAWEAYLDAKSRTDQFPVPRLWDAFLREYEKAKEDRG